ncbi:unnamed protein product [Coregonus sp. 'balchen']|nr:unnamed protein product [Coregonus sp. 'balchen']
MCFKTILYAGVSFEDLTPLKKEFCLEGTPVTLSYNYSRTATGGDEFYWYHQDTAQRPEFLLYISGSEFIKKADPLITRIFVKLNQEKKHLDLEISSAEVTDSSLYYHCKGEEAVDQQSGHVTALEGGLVTLSCNYTTSSTSPNLFWYIQLTRDSPQYVLRRDRYSEGSNSDEFKKRFVSRLNITSSSVPLMIQRLQLSDSAVYYCALRPTVTTGDSVTVQKLRVECCSDNVTSFSMFDDTQKEEETRKCRGEDSVTQSPGDVIATEGEQVTLDCQFDTLDTNPFLFWYKQGADDFPKYMLRRTTFGSDNAIEFQGRFNGHLNLTKIKIVPLMIQRGQMSDSAVYYCALSPLVLRNQFNSKQGVWVATEGGLVTLSYNAAGFKERFDASLNAKTQSVPLRSRGCSCLICCDYWGSEAHNDTGINFYICTSGSHGNDITPTTDKVFGLEGVVIKLSCNYSSASNLQWYRQDPGSL